MIFMKYKKRITIFLAILIACFQSIAQISIININVQPFNISPDALLNVGILNNGDVQKVQLIAQLSGANGDILMSAKSNIFVLQKGINPGLNNERKVLSFEYSGNSQAAYVKSTKNLPSGRYKVCATILIANGSDKLDDFCDEIEAEFNQYLYLVNPFDNDTIESPNPVLAWTHGEPFSILSQGEFYRMVVTEIKVDQKAEDAITVNSPVMVKNYLKEHQIFYPYDAKELKPNSKYAWQVQKISDGVVINKTEAWTFFTKPTEEKKSLKYVVVKSELDGSFYTAYNGEVFFKFSEEYRTQSNLNFTLLDKKSEQIDVKLINDNVVDDKQSGNLIKRSGDNQYMLNLDYKKLPSGFYTLIILNEKKEKFYLKIFLPK